MERGEREREREIDRAELIRSLHGSIDFELSFRLGPIPVKSVARAFMS